MDDVADKVIAYLSARKGQRVANGDMARAFGMEPQKLRLVVEKLVRAGEVVESQGTNRIILFCILTDEEKAKRDMILAKAAQPRPFKPYVMPQAMKDRAAQVKEARDAVKSYFGPMTDKKETA